MPPTSPRTPRPVDTLHGYHRHFQRASMKEIPPQQGSHRLAHVFSERNAAPARSKWAKYSTFQRAGAKNISRHAPTLHAGAIILSSQSPYPTGGIKLTLLGSISAQAVQNSPSTGKTAQNQAFLLAGRVISRRWDPQPPQTTHRPPRLKPLTHLLAQNSKFQAIFRPQRCHGFHAPLAEHPQRRRRFHQTPNQGFWFPARYSDAHACCRRHTPGSVGAVRQ